MSNTATRLITLIMLLQRRPNQKAAELAEQLGVSVRTIQRYIGMLDELTLLDQTFDAPADFDAQEYLATEPHTQPRVQVRSRFAPEAALMALDDRTFWDTVVAFLVGSVLYSSVNGVYERFGDLPYAKPVESALATCSRWWQGVWF